MFLENTKLPTKAVLDTVNDPDALRRMADATVHYDDTPALKAIVKELEGNKQIDTYFRSTRRSRTMRFRQFVGVAVRLVMEDKGFRTTGKKGSLRTTSRWFKIAEIFERADA